MNIELRPLLDYGLQESVALMNRGFADYFVRIELDLSMFINMVRTEGIEAGSCRVIWANGEAAGLALIARRAWLLTSRLAAMSIVPAWRGRGLGRRAMEVLLAEAAARGDRAMVLEVIESNAPAVRLYEGYGFRTERRLVGYEGTFSAGARAELQEVNIEEVAALVIEHGLDNLPWQISGESLAKIGAPNRAYRLDEAYAVISNPEAEQIAIRSLIVRPEARRQGQATRLVKAIIAEHPGRKWMIPALCPEEIGGLFEQIGFARQKISQFQMRRHIS